jgi:hypothetical protein
VAIIQQMRAGLVPDIDVYDSAAWCAPVPLSAESIRKGSRPVAVPDFTRGRWEEAASGPGLRGDRHAAGLREPRVKARARLRHFAPVLHTHPDFPLSDREGEPAVTRRSRATALVAATAIALTACSGGGSDDGSVELTMLAASYSDNTKKLWEEVIAEFEDANPGVTVNLEIQSWRTSTTSSARGCRRTKPPTS